MMMLRKKYMIAVELSQKKKKSLNYSICTDLLKEIALLNSLISNNP